ncbi:MAG: patatin-like phospholipase family protein [Ferruginibacter sp.]
MSGKVHLVLGSGGARGIAHIGVIEMLQSAGYEIASITGCSMGAVVGGMYCAGSLQLYKDWLCTLTKTSVFSLFDFTFTKQGFVKGEKVLGKLKELAGDHEIENLPVPFTAVATDMMHKKEIHFTKGNLYKALRASICIPGIFTPVADEQHLMVDGGVLNPLPLNLVKKQPGEKIIAVNLNGAMPLPAGQQLTNGKPSSLSIISLLNNSYDLTQDRLTELMIQLFPPDILVEIPRNTCTAFEFYRAAELIEAGKQAWTKKILVQ